MEILPIEYCDVSENYIHLNQSLAACAFEHQCGESGTIDCPFKRFFTNAKTRDLELQNEQDGKFPRFYIADL